MRIPRIVSLSSSLSHYGKNQKHEWNQELIFVGEYDPRELMSEISVNRVLRVMFHDPITEVCGYGFSKMTCSALAKQGLL